MRCRPAVLLALALPLIACAPVTQARDPVRQQQPARVPDNPDAFDRDMVRQLVARGADVTKPARVVYSLYIPSRSDAEAAAGRLRTAGYRATVARAVGKLPDGRAETRAWLIASNVAVPSVDHARRERRYFEALAKRYHGEYSGWGADIVK